MDENTNVYNYNLKMIERQEIEQAIAAALRPVMELYGVNVYATVVQASLEEKHFVAFER